MDKLTFIEAVKYLYNQNESDLYKSYLLTEIPANQLD